LTEDGSHSLDSYPSITLSPQSSACGTTLVSRTSTPVDSDYGSLAAEPLGAGTSVSEQGLDGTFVSCNEVSSWELTKKRECTKDNSTIHEYVSTCLIQLFILFFVRIKNNIGTKRPICLHHFLII